MYRVSLTADEYYISANFNSVKTTRNEQDAPILNKGDAKSTLASLRRMGYDALLIPVTESRMETRGLL